MGILNFVKRLGAKPETRGLPSAWHDFWYFNPSYHGASGVPVNPETAMRSAAVFGCVKVISQAIGSLPIMVYKRRSDGGKERDGKHALYPLLHLRPNNYQPKSAYIESILEDLLLRGNHYSQVAWGRNGSVKQLIPLNPDKVEITQLENGYLQYSLRRDNGTKRLFKVDEVMHIRGHSCRGYLGISPIQAASETVGLTLAAEEHGARFFANGTSLQGVLSHPERLDEESSKRISNSWKETFGGNKNAFKTAVIEEGMKYERLTMSNSDAQLIEVRRFQLEEICRIFAVPPHMLADLSRATFTNIEHMAIQFVMHTLMPWIKKIEEAFQIYLFGENNEEEFAEFLVDGLLRGDIKARYDAYAVGRQWGWLSVNRICKLENMDPIGPEGDTFLVPMNMVDAKKFKDMPIPGSEPKQLPDDSEDDDDEKPKKKAAGKDKIPASQINSFLPIFTDVVTRCVRRQKKIQKPLSEFRDDHRGFLANNLRAPITVALDMLDGNIELVDSIISSFVNRHLDADHNARVLEAEEIGVCSQEASAIVTLIQETL